ncbi:MAG: YigZ family protein [Lachnospiraceae bacterium]|nr:YigZ family protein [Lachnospiraceae bacterium]
MSEYKCVLKGGTGQITEKKSRFICHVRPVENEEEATAFINEMKKQYWDARHNCSAFVIGKNSELTRCSDDGEPAGTAGRPMLEVLINEELKNTAVVVTRYFGGVLLGTGGLVRAYQAAVKEGLNASEIITKKTGVKACIKTDYTGIGKLQYLFEKNGYTTLDTQYGESVEFTLLIPSESWNAAVKAVTETTSGNNTLNKVSECTYASSKGKVIIF